MDTKEKIAKEAYDAGFNAGRKQGITLGIEMGIQHSAQVMNTELHRFKFPDDHEDRPGIKIDSLRPKDNSTFEFTYMKYEDRVKEKEANARRARRHAWKKNAPSMKKLWKYAPKEAK